SIVWSGFSISGTAFSMIEATLLNTTDSSLALPCVCACRALFFTRRTAPHRTTHLELEIWLQRRDVRQQKLRRQLAEQLEDHDAAHKLSARRDVARFRARQNALHHAGAHAAANRADDPALLFVLVRKKLRRASQRCSKAGKRENERMEM